MRMIAIGHCVCPQWRLPPMAPEQAAASWPLRTMSAPLRQNAIPSARCSICALFPLRAVPASRRAASPLPVSKGAARFRCWSTNSLALQATVTPAAYHPAGRLAGPDCCSGR